MILLIKNECKSLIMKFVFGGCNISGRYFVVVFMLRRLLIVMYFKRVLWEVWVKLNVYFINFIWMYFFVVFILKDWYYLKVGLLYRGWCVLFL